MDSYNIQQTAAAVATVSVIYALYRRYNRPSLRDIPGPPRLSWFYGNQLEASACLRSSYQYRNFEGHEWFWQNKDASVNEKHLLENYGTVARWNGPLGVHVCLRLRSPMRH